jgi:disease resistance protein RPM1
VSTVTATNINASGDGFFQKLRYFEINRMVQFQQHNKEFSSISLHIWNGEGAMPFGSGKSNCSKVVPSGVMPSLEVSTFNVPLRALKDNNGDCTNFGVEYLASLREIKAWINCDGVCTEEVDAAMAALRNACKVHPNHPTLDLQTYLYIYINRGKISGSFSRPSICLVHLPLTTGRLRVSSIQTYIYSPCLDEFE